MLILQLFWQIISSKEGQNITKVDGIPFEIITRNFLMLILTINLLMILFILENSNIHYLRIKLG